MKQSVFILFCFHYTFGKSVVKLDCLQLKNKAFADISTDFNNLIHNQNLKINYTNKKVHSKYRLNKIKKLRKLKHRSRFSMIQFPKIGLIHRNNKIKFVPNSTPSPNLHRSKPEVIRSLETDINPEKNFASLHALKTVQRDSTTNSRNFKKFRCKNVPNLNNISKFNCLFRLKNLERKSIKKKNNLI